MRSRDRRPDARPDPGSAHAGRTRGERAADALRNGMGSWRFVAAFGIAMAAWIAANAVLPSWDPYPIILLNLALSMIAAVQGAILLIAARRQDAIAAALAEHDYETDLAARQGVERLIALIGEQNELLRDLRDHPARDEVSRAPAPAPAGTPIP